MGNRVPFVLVQEETQFSQPTNVLTLKGTNFCTDVLGRGASLLPYVEGRTAFKIKEEIESLMERLTFVPLICFAD